MHTFHHEDNSMNMYPFIIFIILILVVLFCFFAIIYSIVRCIHRSLRYRYRFVSRTYFWMCICYFVLLFFTYEFVSISKTRNSALIFPLFSIHISYSMCNQRPFCKNIWIIFATIQQFLFITKWHSFFSYQQNSFAWSVCQIIMNTILFLKMQMKRIESIEFSCECDLSLFERRTKQLLLWTVSIDILNSFCE